MNKVDGYVVIEARAATDKFEKQIQDLEMKYRRKEIDMEFTDKDLYDSKSLLDEMNTSLEKQQKEYAEINKQIKEQENIINRIKNTPSDFKTYEGRLAYNSLQEQSSRASSEIYRLVQKQILILDEIKKQNDAIVEQELKVEKISAKYEKQKVDLEDITQKITNIQAEQDQVNTTVTKSEFNFGKLLRKVTGVGLAVLGIRSAYNFVRNAMNSVLAGNETLSKQFEGMKQSLYGALAPVIEKIVNLLRTLMAYMNYIWQRLTGHILFAEKGTLNTSKNLASGAKSAKEINKQLASFDEANVLSTNQSSGGGIGGGGDSGNYDIGLSKIKIPSWLEKFMDWVDEHPTLSKILFGLAAFTLFGGWKLAGGILSTITTLLGGGAGAGATGLIGILGTMLLIAGTVIICKITYDQVKKAIKSYQEMREAQKEANETTESSMKKSGEKQRQILEETMLLDKDNEQRKKNIETIKSLIEIDDQFVYETLDGRKTQKAAEEEYKKQLGQTVLAFDSLRQSGELTEEEQYEYYKLLKTYLTPEQIANAEQLGLTAQEAYHLRDGFEELNKKYKTQYDADMKPAHDAFNNFINQTKNTLQKPIQVKLSADIEILTDKVKKALGVYHASGGIVNLPGRGVPVTHYAGEAGREGLVPMDNESQMALLGSEIAKRVTINLTNVTEMNGRTISKELKKISNESDFAFNR